MLSSPASPVAVLASSSIPLPVAMNNCFPSGRISGSFQAKDPFADEFALGHLPLGSSDLAGEVQPLPLEPRADKVSRHRGDVRDLPRDEALRVGRCTLRVEAVEEHVGARVLKQALRLVRDKPLQRGHVVAMGSRDVPQLQRETGVKVLDVDANDSKDQSKLI